MHPYAVLFDFLKLNLVFCICNRQFNMHSSFLLGFLRILREARIIESGIFANVLFCQSFLFSLVLLESIIVLNDLLFFGF